MDHTVTEMGERRLDLELDPIRVELVLRDEAVLPGLEVRSYAASLPRRSNGMRRSGIGLVEVAEEYGAIET